VRVPFVGTDGSVTGAANVSLRAGTATGSAGGSIAANSAGSGGVSRGGATDLRMDANDGSDGNESDAIDASDVTGAQGRVRGEHAVTQVLRTREARDCLR